MMSAFIPFHARGGCSDSKWILTGEKGWKEKKRDRAGMKFNVPNV